MIEVTGPWFKDEFGRVLILRGVNLSGSSKVPYRPNGATHIRENFFAHREVSFVGRPFPLEEADEHFARLRRWGFTFLRFLVTWEAIEHAGPGQYDQDYLEYLYAVVRKAGEHGLRLFIDPHQDVWSRFTGGDGAPGWTLEAVGFELTQLAATGAALVHALHGDPFPTMIWPTNYGKLAAATMFTLFFAGSAFAPVTRVEGEPVQEFLQRHYLQAMLQVVRRLRGLPQVVGYDTLNEPASGYIGWPDVRGLGKMMLRKGLTPTPLQAMALGEGLPQEVEVWAADVRGERVVRREWVDPHGARAWRAGMPCVWRANGVWEVDEAGHPRALRPAHFAQVQGQPVDFVRDFYRPFAVRYAQTIRGLDPDALIFLEGIPNEATLTWDPQAVPRVVNASHWYDGWTLFTKHYAPFWSVDVMRRKVLIGGRAIQAAFNAQVAEWVRVAREQMGNIPTLIGEFGIPFDLNGRRAFRDGNYAAQAAALDRSFRAIEANLVSATLWNYTPDNTHERGDQWNGEDLSLFSLDDRRDPQDPDSGGRALEAAVRPYPRAVAGIPLHYAYDYRRRRFILRFRHDPAVTAPTEIFVPAFFDPQQCRVQVSDGRYEWAAAESVLLYHHSAERDEHEVRLKLG